MKQKQAKTMIERFRRAIVEARDRREQIRHGAAMATISDLQSGIQVRFSQWACEGQLQAELCMLNGLTYELAYLRSDKDLVRSRDYLRGCFKQADVEWPRLDAVPWVMAELDNWRPVDVGLLNERLGPVDGLPGWSWYAHDNEFLLGLVRDDGEEAYLVHGLDGVTSWGDVVHGIDCDDGYAQEVW